MAVASKAENTKLLNTLSDLGGGRVQEDDIEFSGTRLVIPSRMSVKRAISVLERHQVTQEEHTRFSRTFRYRPWDGAAATARALKRVTGFSGLPKAIRSFFGSTPPQLMTIPVGPNDFIQVPWGALEVPILDGTIYLDGTTDEEFGELFVMNIDAPRKHRSAVEGLFKVVQDELELRSIYRGKAFDGKSMPDFLDLDGVERDQVIYSDEVEGQLDANIWAVLRHADAMKRNDVPLKRSVLMHGPYGTGKTLAAHLTAQVAVENEWTFISCRPGKDNILSAMATARLYQPSVVFFEDVDNISSGTDGDAVTKLLDVFDGISSKNTEILAILTTNHPERIHKGMIRPGRLDAVIEISTLDEGGIGRFIAAKVPANQLADDIDVPLIAEAMEGYLPAFVSEAIDRAKRYSIARTGTDPDELTNEDFVQAAHGLRTQFEMMNDAGEGSGRPSLDKVMEGMVTTALTDNIHLVDRYDDEFAKLVQNGS